MALTLTKLSETKSTITLGWSPPAGVGGYVFWANGQSVSTGSPNLKDGSPRNSVRFSKTNPGPPFHVTAICRVGSSYVLEVGSYQDAAPPPPPPPDPEYPAGWLSGPSADATFKAAVPPPGKGALVGIWDSGHAGITRIVQRENEVGRRLDIGAGSYYGGTPNSDGKMTAVKADGRLPLVDAGHYGAACVQDIVNGSRDSYIRSFVRAASAIGGPVFLRHFHEYAGPWMAAYWWDAARSRRATPVEWQAMNRKPVDIARAEGITNIIWIWCATIYDDRAAVFASYPGDTYVDLVGDDNYGYADVQWAGDRQVWATHAMVHNYPVVFYPAGDPRREQFKMLHEAFPQKPFAVMETGRAPHSTDVNKKRDWLAEMPAHAKQYLPRMVMQIYSDYGLEADANGREWTLDVPASALDGYRTAVNDPYFKTRPVALGIQPFAAVADVTDSIPAHIAPSDPASGLFVDDPELVALRYAAA